MKIITSVVQFKYLTMKQIQKILEKLFLFNTILCEIKNGKGM